MVVGRLLYGFNAMIQALEQLALDASWQRLLAHEFEQPYMQQLDAFLQQQALQGKTIFPPQDQIFSALNHTLFDDVQVVILGQDPYHGAGQAQGLSFSVPAGIKIPPSLRNIYKELHADLGGDIPTSGDLQAWADQGVLLLNAVLTVEEKTPNAHQGQGWEAFTDSIIAHLSAQREHLVFMLWGAYAQRKGEIIDTTKHCILSAPHPSPFSAYKGFLGCGHFSKANNYLQQWGNAPIQWQV